MWIWWKEKSSRFGNSSQELRLGHEQWWHRCPSCRFWNLLGISWCAPLVPDMDGHIDFGSKSGFKLTSSFFVSSKLFVWNWCGGKTAKETAVFGAVKNTPILYAFLKGHAHALACQAAQSAHSAELILRHTEGWVNESTLRACGLREQEKHIRIFWTGHIRTHIRRCKGLQQGGHAPQLGHPHSLLMLRTGWWREQVEGPGWSQELGAGCGLVLFRSPVWSKQQGVGVCESTSLLSLPHIWHILSHSKDTYGWPVCSDKYTVDALPAAQEDCLLLLLSVGR